RWLHILLIMCSFIRADIRPNKIARRQVNLAEQQAPKPQFQAVCGERFEANTPTSQGSAEEQALPVQLNRSTGADAPCAHLRIVQVLKFPADVQMHRSWAPLSCGWPGRPRSRSIPSATHQTESRLRPKSPCIL